MTIKEMSKNLHLSVSTISKALNGAFDVSDETKEMVLKYAKEHGYKARDERLKVTKLRRLCFIYDNESNLIMTLSLAFAQAARQNNFEVIQVPVSTIKTSYQAFMKENNFDGAFVAGLNYDNTIANEFRNTKIPTVIYDSDISGERISTIGNENINSIKELVTHLASLGHTKIGFINGDKKSFVTNERFAGYIIGQVVNDIEYNPKYVYYGNFSEETGYEAAKYYADQTDVTAIVCSSDIIAVGLINGLRQNGFLVPGDISVTGYDGLDITNYFNPPITTIKQDLEGIGEKALTLITSMLMNRSSQRLIIKGDVIYRSSTAIARNR